MNPADVIRNSVFNAVDVYNKLNDVQLTLLSNTVDTPLGVMNAWRLKLMGAERQLGFFYCDGKLAIAEDEGGDNITKTDLDHSVFSTHVVLDWIERFFKK